MQIESNEQGADKMATTDEREDAKTVGDYLEGIDTVSLPRTWGGLAALSGKRLSGLKEDDWLTVHFHALLGAGVLTDAGDIDRATKLARLGAIAARELGDIAPHEATDLPRAGRAQAILERLAQEFIAKAATYGISVNDFGFVDLDQASNNVTVELSASWDSDLGKHS
jgi:hypothetical protein